MKRQGRKQCQRGWQHAHGEEKSAHVEGSVTLHRLSGQPRERLLPTLCNETREASARAKKIAS
jgi:hypothetical protein